MNDIHQPWDYLTGLADPNTGGEGDRPQVTVIHRGDSETVIRLAFRAGQAMTEHTAAHPIVVLGQTGSVDFTVGGQTYELIGGTAIRVDTRIPHSLRAGTDGNVTLIVVHGNRGGAQ